MVKPPKNMEPEAVDLGKAGRSAGKAFEDDSFRNYMARKIDLQRKQFGLQLPPDPRSIKAVVEKEPAIINNNQRKRKRQHVRFAEDVKDHDAIARKKSSNNHPKKKRKKEKKTPMSAMLKRLKRRHGSGFKRAVPKKSLEIIEEDEDEGEEETAGDDEIMLEPTSPIETELGSSNSKVSNDGNRNDVDSKSVVPNQPELRAQFSDEEVNDENEEEKSKSPQQSAAVRTVAMARERPDLFFFGIVAMVNGYTSPDTETLQRLLHRHGGDLEKYETSRITHIIAEHLSTAKANIYKRMRRPIPVVHPSWIVNSVKAQKLLPHAEYLIEEVKDNNTTSVRSFFQASAKSNGQRKQNTLAKERQLNEIKESPPAEVNPENDLATCKDFQTNPLERRFPNHAVPPGDSNTSASKSEVSFGKTDDKYINGKLRTVGTDPNFLESFFQNSRLSFIGSYKQRLQGSPSKGSKDSTGTDIPRERFVFHADMDCFFAAVVLRNFPQYRDKPVVICHHGKAAQEEPYKPTNNSSSECATCNYEARKYGIEKGMFLGRAKQLCPELVILNYDFEGYEAVSEQVATILQRYAAKFHGQVEQVSCDESYVELFFPRGEGPHDPYHVAGEVADRMRREILEVTRCTATIGVAKNKFLSKLATDRVKPNRSFVVRKPAELLRNLKLKDLHGIGWRTEPKLNSEGLVYVQDVWDLGQHGESQLCAILGQGLGKKIWGFCNGDDDRPVKEVERKSIGAECNYGVRFDGPYGVNYMIEGLAKEVQKRMEAMDVRGSQVTLKLKQRKKEALPPPKFLGHGSCHNLSKSALVNGGATRDWKVLSELGETLFAELNVHKDDVRGMGIMVTKLEITSSENSNTAHPNNQSITNWFTSKRKAQLNTVGQVEESGNEGSTTSAAASSTRAEKVELNLTKVESAEDVADRNPSSSQIDPSILAELPLDIQEEVAQLSRERKSVIYPNVADSRYPMFDSQQWSQPRNSEHVDDDELSTSSADLHIDEGDKVSKEEAPPASQFVDVALPPLSQIHLSQVEELPSPLKKQINAKIAARNGTSDVSIQKQTIRSRSFESSKAPKRMCQVSVKRMFRLAEMKAEKSTSEGNKNWIAELPLKLQLQIANDDNDPLGKADQTTKNRRSSASRAKTARDDPHYKGHAMGRNHREILPSRSWDGSVESHDRPESLCEEMAEEVQLLEPIEFPDFYNENVAPLSHFMDENRVATKEALDQVAEFLNLCVKENRVLDAVKLLRHIRNREDDWSNTGFAHLFNAVDSTCHDLRGYHLDRKGLQL